MKTKWTSSKIILILFSIGIIAVSLFVFLLYFTLKTKSRDISNEKPFVEWIGKPLVLNAETFLVKEDKANYDNSKFPYLLSDSTSYNYDDLVRRNQIRIDKSEPCDVCDITFLETFPVGTVVTFHKAVMTIGGVSGSANLILYGIVKHNNQEYAVGYYWGREDHSKRADTSGFGMKRYYKFSQAPWQTKQDTTRYVIKDAQW